MELNPKITEMKKYLFLSVLIIVIVFGFQFCNKSSSNNEELRAKIVDTNNEIFNKRNFEYADKAFTQNYAGQGPQFIKDFAIGITTAFPDLEVKTEKIIVEGNHAGWYRTSTGTHKKEYRGYPPSGEKISWTEILISEYDNKGLIAKEWYATDMDQKLSETNKIDGVFEYLPPLKGQSINRNGKFTYLYGPADGSAPMISQAGTYNVADGIVKNTVTYSTETSQLGREYWWKVKSWDGDTVTFETMNVKGELTGGGRSIKIAD